MELVPNGEPVVIAKPESPFFLNPKFLAVGLGIILVLIALGGYSFLQSKPTPPQPQQIAKPIKPLKNLVGTIETIDSKKSMITIKNSHGENLTFPVSQDVLVSQIVLGAKAEEGKQITLPTDILYLEDLKNKNGAEVYLVFDDVGTNVIQIQIHSKNI